MKNLVVVLFFSLFFATQAFSLTFTEDFSGPTINSFWWTPGSSNGNTLELDTNSKSLKMHQNTTSGSAGLTFNYNVIVNAPDTPNPIPHIYLPLVVRPGT